jgi:hypothetical protein
MGVIYYILAASSSEEYSLYAMKLFNSASASFGYYAVKSKHCKIQVQQTFRPLLRFSHHTDLS